MPLASLPELLRRTWEQGATPDPKKKPNTNHFSRQTLNLRRPASASPFAQPRDYKRVLPSERLSDSAFKVSDLEL